MRPHEMKPHERIVFAMDVPDLKTARKLGSKLRGKIGVLKIGLELFAAAGTSAVQKMAKDFDIFLDLKLHDIPATVGRSAAVCRDMGVKWLTVHVASGSEALAQAVWNGPKILGVTRLTSLARGRGMKADVRRKTEMARSSGCAGVICPPHMLEATSRERAPMIAVTPGITMDRKSKRDHAVAWLPEEAIGAGADLIVVGRAIRDADDPARAAEEIASRIAEGMSSRKG